MRIIAGKYKSRKVHTVSPAKEHCVKGAISGFRPTTDRAKETLFNVLNNLIDFKDLKCLDLFAGSGSLGFEALSRGAKSCDFVESSQKQANIIERTAAELGCGDNIEIHNSDVIRFLMHSKDEFYDLIFADPPYAYEDYTRLTSEVLKLKFSIFVLEYGFEVTFLYDVNEFEVIDKKIGMTNFKIFITKD